MDLECEVGPCSYNIQRFCRARKFDYPAVKAMIIAAEQWRKEFGVDDIIQ